MSAEQISQIKNQQVESRQGTKGEKGSGMGLVLVTQLLQQINATLEIESEQGKGSVFRVVFGE
jgi:signal transduction histidine kinase